MQFAAHLPLMDFGGNPYTLDALTSYASKAANAGYVALAANDHLVFSTPWLDGPTALAAVLEASGELQLATTVSLPVVRGPIHLAKALGAIDRLSGGRMLVGVGPGSSDRDHDVAGLDFSERWKRLDESVQVMRTLWNPDLEPFVGRYYSTEGIDLEPYPSQTGGPPIWIGSWGSPAGLRRVARLGDGWLASAYNTDPAGFAAALGHLDERLADEGRDPGGFPNGLATMWFYITEDASEADRMIRDRIAPVIHRPVEVLRERLPIGSPESFAAKLDAYESAGVQRVYLWPVADETHQLHLFMDQVVPLLT